MNTRAEDLQFVKEAIPELQEYLLSNELYWPLSGTLPRLTPGALLLALARLSVTAPAESQNLAAQVENIRNRWQTAWNTKAGREVTNRTRLWSQYLSDYLSSPEQNQDSYRNEIRSRVILQLLLADLPGLPEESVLAELDATLKGRLVTGKILWDAELETVFPAKRFWFLYGSL